jgi:hypothetical protein
VTWTSNQILTAAQLTSAFGNSGWSPFTTTFTGTGFSYGSSTQAFRYMQIGKTVFVRGTMVVNGVTWGSNLKFTQPNALTEATYPFAQKVGDATFTRSTGPQVWYGAVLANVAAGNMWIVWHNVSSTYMYSDDQSSATPFTHANGDVLSVNYFYEMA